MLCKMIIFPMDVQIFSKSTKLKIMGCDQHNGIRLRQVSYEVLQQISGLLHLSPYRFHQSGNHLVSAFAYLNHSPDTQQFRIKCGTALVHIISVRMDVHSSIRGDARARSSAESAGVGEAKLMPMLRIKSSFHFSYHSTQ